MQAANAAAMRTALELGNVDNTADASKPVSTATQTALDLKADQTDLDATNTAVALNTAKTGITTEQANAIIANTAKRSYPSADETKLAGIEAGATSDQTAAEIEALLDAYYGSTTWRDAGGGGGLAATDIDTLAELNAILTDATLIDTNDSRLSDARTPTAHTHTASEVTDFATAVSSNAAVAANTAKNSYPSADATKLAGIETGATADQTGAEIKTAYEGEADTNAYTDAEKTKLAGVATAATANPNAVDSDVTGITGADAIANIVSLTQAEYDAIGTPDASTFYIITD